MGPTVPNTRSVDVGSQQKMMGEKRENISA